MSQTMEAGDQRPLLDVIVKETLMTTLKPGEDREEMRTEKWYRGLR